ncbi:MAG: 16S rRNA (cytosine(1402)-N(4))-methyltransferase RsmH [Sedimentisphaerales bacterium]|nr:16S rRNA (cytosine(1402)-N(4))-methyltransferase RsmH [Sedimentisphaerales bacterium]
MKFDKCIEYWTKSCSSAIQYTRTRYKDIHDTIEENGSITEHIPVLSETLVEQIKLPPDGIMVDATTGQGGHSLLFGKTLGPAGAIIGFDVDKNAIQRAQIILKDLCCKVILIHSNFSRICEKVHEQKIDKVDFILADLGLCSAQLADSRMGLSFLEDMPLDMRIDKRIKHTAADIVNKADEKSLADLIYEFGQDRASRRIARFIVHERKGGPIKTTGQLAKIVCRALGKASHGQKRRIHPATRTFQALRIAVNNELENLKILLDSSPGLLNKNGYSAVISYHSLEDRLVKYNFRQNEKEGIYNIITKKPIVPSREEITKNRRARSAKLRIAQKK